MAEIGALKTGLLWSGSNVCHSAGPSDLVTSQLWTGSALGWRAPGPSLQIAGCWVADQLVAGC